MGDGLGYIPGIAVLGERTVLSRGYSDGEIAPFAASTKCELHNQTMTITTLTER